ncbi:MAG: hypothetical protein LBI44_04030 [Oscillospiraceae bacterium]|jgi:hypothetical protein|nr:hypothetical protein [Oscillospiraceae bacterium]
MQRRSYASSAVPPKKSAAGVVRSIFPVFVLVMVVVAVIVTYLRTEPRDKSLPRMNALVLDGELWGQFLNSVSLQKDIRSRAEVLAKTAAVSEDSLDAIAAYSRQSVDYQQQMITFFNYKITGNVKGSDFAGPFVDAAAAYMASSADCARFLLAAAQDLTDENKAKLLEMCAATEQSALGVRQARLTFLRESGATEEELDERESEMQKGR